MKKRPNVLVFLTDDQRYNTIHCLGNDEIHTPNLDSFCSESIAFTNAHIMGGTCGAVCMPSRAMLLTGRDLFSLKGQGKGNGSCIPEEHKNMPEYLMKNGYYSEHIGKWHQDKESFNRSYTNAASIHAFTSGYWCGTNGGQCQPYLFDYDPTGEYMIEKAYNLDENHKKVPADLRKGRIYSTDIFCDSAIDFLNTYKEEEPFYLYVATVSPHDPRDAPIKYEEMYNTQNVSTPENFIPVHPFDNGQLFSRDEMLEDFPRTPQKVRRHIADYYGMISHIDARFGDIINTLKKNNMYKDTIIVFAGDNGLALGSHGLLGKQNVYEHSIRVPLIIKPADKFTPKICNTFCYLFDVFPTICDLCGLEIPDTVNGKSLKPIIYNEKEKIRDDIFAAYRNFQRCYKNYKYKIIEYHVNGEFTQQLFDLENDPMEMKDLSKNPQYNNILNQMHDKLLENEKKYKDPLVTQDKDILDLNVW